MQSGPGHPFRFGEFEVDPETGELRRNGQLIRIPPQPFRLLLLLASHSGHVVSREEIKRQLWGEDTFVDFDQGVNFSIRQIREALGDTAEDSRYVQTVPRRGYRFLQVIEPIAATAGIAEGLGSLLDTPNSDLHKLLWTNIADIRLAERRRRRLLVALTTLAVLLAGYVVLRLLR